MTIAGQGSGDIIRQITQNVFNVFRKKKSICTAPCDGVILKMHYQWTFWVLLAGFSSVWYSWFFKDVITCASHFNADPQVRLDLINVCLSYPYIELPNSEKRYLLFYRWIHWSLLFLAFCFYIPRKFSKNFDNPKVKKLLEDLSTYSNRYDETEKELANIAARYITFNINTHNDIYFKFVACNLIALAVDIFCMFYLDMLFQGRFLTYGWMAYPFARDPKHFTDYMSETFPQFVSCQITPEYQLLSTRKDIFGCHLIAMEYYDMLFLFIWFWLTLLIIITLSYLIFLAFMFHPYFRFMILKVAKPSNSEFTVSETVINVLDNCEIGDIYLLYRLKFHLSSHCFSELMMKLSDKKLMKNMTEESTDQIDMVQNKNYVKKRKLNMNGKKFMVHN